jgi:hypothetical protein
VLALRLAGSVRTRGRRAASEKALKLRLTETML